MGKMTVAEAAEHFKVSKEAIHNRVRRGTLNSVTENGVKYVILAEAKRATPSPPSDTRYYEYIEKENERLKSKLDTLESETSRLRHQREQMLLDDREKIERIYKERDEQLKSILQVVATNFLGHSVAERVIEEVEVTEVLEAKELESEVRGDVKLKKEELVSLKDFMKLKLYGKKKRQRLKERFEQRAKKDARIIIKDKTLFLNPQHFDYSDLLK